MKRNKKYQGSCTRDETVAYTTVDGDPRIGIIVRRARIKYLGEAYFIRSVDGEIMDLVNVERIVKSLKINKIRKYGEKLNG